MQNGQVMLERTREKGVCDGLRDEGRVGGFTVEKYAKGSDGVDVPTGGKQLDGQRQFKRTGNSVDLGFGKRTNRAQFAFKMGDQTLNPERVIKAGDNRDPPWGGARFGTRRQLAGHD